MRCAGASNSFWVKNPRPSEEPATPTRRSKNARPLRRGISKKYGHERQDVHLLCGLYLPTECFYRLISQMKLLRQAGVLEAVPALFVHAQSWWCAPYL
jgi:hypothetical protein